MKENQAIQVYNNLLSRVPQIGPYCTAKNLLYYISHQGTWEFLMATISQKSNLCLKTQRRVQQHALLTVFKTIMQSKKVRWSENSEVIQITPRVTELPNMQWRRSTINGTKPPERCWHCGFRLGHSYYVLNGVFVSPDHRMSALSDFWELSLDAFMWSELRDTGITPRAAWGMCSCTSDTNKDAFAFGGRGVDFEVYGDLYHFDRETKKWEVLPANGKDPTGRPCLCAAGMSCVGNSLVCFGGIESFPTGSNADALFSNSVFVYSLEKKCWMEQMTTGPGPSPRAWHAQCSCGIFIYVFGGVGGPKFFNELWVLNTQTWQWDQPFICGLCPPHMHSSSLSLLDSGELLQFGGGVPYPCDTFSIFAVYTPGNQEWKQFRAMGLGPPQLYGHTTFLFDGQVYIFGGQDPQATYHNAIYILEDKPDYTPDMAAYEASGEGKLPAIEWIHQRESTPYPKERAKKESKFPSLKSKKGGSTDSAGKSKSVKKAAKPVVKKKSSSIKEIKDPAEWQAQYEPMKKLGRGGFSTISLVKRRDNGQLLACKRSLLKTATTENRSRILDEVTVHQLISAHPNIVHFYEAYLVKGHSVIIIMEYCDGGDMYSILRTLDERGEFLPEVQVIRWFFELTSAVRYIHSLLLMHGDLKSANVLFVTAADGMHVRLCDFGMTAKQLSDIGTQALKHNKEINGTPEYMAPECLSQFAPPSQKTDIWALGVLLYEMISLRLPFSGSSLSEIIKQVTRSHPPTLPPGFSGELQNLVNGLLSKRAAARPSLEEVLLLPLFQEMRNEMR